jgi:hypothetical protein
MADRPFPLPDRPGRERDKLLARLRAMLDEMRKNGDTPPMALVELAERHPPGEGS